MDKIPAQMVLSGDLLSRDGQIVVTDREASDDGKKITLVLSIGGQEHRLVLAYNSKVPIYNYTKGGSG